MFEKEEREVHLNPWLPWLRSRNPRLVGLEGSDQKPKWPFRSSGGLSPEHGRAAAIFHIIKEAFEFSCQSYRWLFYFGRWLLGYFYGSNNRDISLHCILRRRGPWKWFFLWKESSHSLSVSAAVTYPARVNWAHAARGGKEFVLWRQKGIGSYLGFSLRSLEPRTSTPNFCFFKGERK